MRNIREIADAADVIVNGYAYTKDGENIRVLNLNNPEKAAYLNRAGEVLETSMDDIELEICDVFKKFIISYLLARRIAKVKTSLLGPIDSTYVYHL